MPFKTGKSYITADLMLSGVDSYDATTLPSNQIKILPSDGAANDEFGRSVSVGSGRIVVGAYGDGGKSGSAYIFDLDGNQLAKITASDGALNDEFGRSVSVGSGRIIIGAAKDSNSSGSAYIFDLDGNYITKITAADSAIFDQFGRSVAVGSGRIVVGSYRDDDNGADSGSAYIFDLDGNQLAKITAPDGTDSDYFGWSVAVGSGRIVVGAYQDDDNGADSGSAYIFDLDGNYLSKIVSVGESAGDRFGEYVSVGSGRIVVGSSLDDDNGVDSGATYIFDLDGTYLSKITAPDGTDSDFFGASVSVGSGRIVVGANGDDDNGAQSGSSYIFDFDGNHLAKITASDGAASDFFGFSVSVGSGRIVVGAYGDDDNGSLSGSAYIYTTPNIKHTLGIQDEY